MFFFVVSIASAQTASEAPKTLAAPANWTVTDLPVAPLLGEIVSGPNSTLYFRRQFPNENTLEGAITILASSGKSRTINPREGTGLLGRVIFSAFNVDAEGNLYAVANSSQENDSYLIAYDKDGHFLWKSALRPGIHAAFLLPVNNNRFLVSGIILSSMTKKKPLQSITSLFGSGGNELKSLKLPDDDSQQSADGKDGMYFNSTIELGNARVGPDGNIYLFKASSIPRVIVLDTEGKTLRTLKLVPPNKTAQASDFFISGRGIAVSYQPLSTANLALYNAETGALVQTYSTISADGRGMGILAGLEDNSLIFMGPTADHKNFRLGRTPLT